MLAKLGSAFDSDEHLFEVKWDGTRALAFCEGDGYRLLNRKQRRLAERYPELSTPLSRVERGCVLDGEVCVLVDGNPSFRGMLRREQASGARRFAELARELPATYVVFDLLWRGFESLEHEPLRNRREALREVVDAVDHPRLVFPDGVVGSGLAFFDRVVRLDLEGIVAKRLDSRYHAGQRTDEWTKIKRRESLHCVVLGYQAEGDDLRSLVVASDADGELRCLGKVGSGLRDAVRTEITRRLEGHELAAPVIDCGDVDAVWVEPVLFCVVSYLERSETGLRAPVFEGLVERD